MAVPRLPERRRRDRSGFTLFEMLIVVVILASISAVAIGARRSVEPQRLESAAGEIANALRYARQEAMRHAELRAVWVGISENRVGVFESQLDGGGNSVAGAPLDHPVDRRPWVFDVDGLPMTRGVRLRPGLDFFVYSGASGRKNLVVFDEFGLPVFWVGGTRRSLNNGSIRLELGDHELTIKVMPNGRVVVQ